MVNEYLENVAATLHLRQRLAIQLKTMNISPEKASECIVNYRCRYTIDLRIVFVSSCTF